MVRVQDFALVHVHHFAVVVQNHVVQAVVQIVQNHVEIVVEIVQHHVQQLVEEVVLFHVVIIVQGDVLVHVLQDVMDVLVHVELPVVVVVQDVQDARVHVNTDVRLVVNLDVLLDVTDAVGLVEIHALDAKDVHLDVREAVQDVKLHVEVNVHQAAETNVVVVGIVVMEVAGHRVPILVLISVLMVAILARLDAQEGARVIVMVVPDHVEAAAAVGVDLRVHQVVLAVLAVVGRVQEAVEAVILLVTIAVQDVVVDAVVALQNVPDAQEGVTDALEAVL